MGLLELSTISTFRNAVIFKNYNLKCLIITFPWSAQLTWWNDKTNCYYSSKEVEKFSEKKNTLQIKETYEMKIVYNS